MATELVEIRDKEIRIERFSEQHIPDFIKLFKISFEKSISRDQVQLKYDTSKLGGNYVGHMAYHNDTPIAYYGVLPVPFVLDGQLITAVQSADTMTHPDYRRHGLFPFLATKTYELAKDEGASFVFGWPNQNSYPSFQKKLGWIDLGKMIRFTIKLRTAPLAKLSVKVPLLRGPFMWLFRKVAGVSSINTELENADFTVPRNSAYLDYKQSLGAFQIDTEFGTVVASLDYRLKIGAFQKTGSEDLPLLFARLKRICLVCGIDEIQVIEGPKSSIAKVLSNAGLKKSEDLPLMYWPFNEYIEIDHLNLTGLDYDGF